MEPGPKMESMNTPCTLALLASLLVLPSLASQAPAPATAKAAIPQPDPEHFVVLDHALKSRAVELAKLSASEALALALEGQDGMQATRIELELRGSLPVFTVELGSSMGSSGASAMNVLINARTGRRLGHQDAVLPREAAARSQLVRAFEGAQEEGQPPTPEVRHTLAEALHLAEAVEKGKFSVRAEVELRHSRPHFVVESIDATGLFITSFGTKGDVIGGAKMLLVPKPDSKETTPAPRAWTFEGGEPKAQLAAWQFTVTNPGRGQAAWALKGDADSLFDSTALTLTASHSGTTFNLALARGTSFGDVNMRARVRAQTGHEDQGGGVLWRAKDADNYYVCRFNPLENNFRVYKVQDGRRTELGSADVETRPKRWYTVRAQMVGDHITCYLDGKPFLDVHDATFTQPGMVGLWTKADASSDFDDIAVQAVHWSTSAEGPSKIPKR